MIVFLFFCLFICFVNTVSALEIFTSDLKQQAAQEEGNLEDSANWAYDVYMWFDKWANDSLAATTWKTALGNFLNRLAYDTATYLATGDKGQASMFQTDSLGEFLANAADYAAGDFLEAIGRSNDWGEFNLCNPNINVKIRIGMGLYSSKRPKEPACTFTEMLGNWEEELRNPNFLNNFQDMFNPWSNDFGIALTLQSGMEQEASQAATVALNEWLRSTFKPVTEKISGKIKTPAEIVEARSNKALNDSTSVEKSFTGNILADAISTFINTLIAKLINEWFTKGLVNDFPDYSYDWDSLSYLSDYEAGSYKGGTRSAEERFRTLIEPEFKESGNYEALSELVNCPDPSHAGPTECVITDKFRQAIDQKLTVGEAMRQGYLNPSGVFGFIAGGSNDNPPEPAYHEGYPYRSMIILRKYRILPLGWELAAEYIKNNLKDIKNLQDLVNCYDPKDSFGDSGDWEAWCEGLVDPNWVLMAPLNYCGREGPGEFVRSQGIIGQGEGSQVSLSRDKNYCADEQTCIVEGKNDTCDYYGYCTEDRRSWDFNAEACDPLYNTCETFRSRGGETNSYLENTLDFGMCTADNVGCRDYCEDYSYAAGEFTCTFGGGDKLFLDQGAEACQANNEGCHEFIRTNPDSGVNLLYNSSFGEIGETDSLDDGIGDTFRFWGNIGEAASNGFHNNTALKLNGGFNQDITVGPAGNSVEFKSFALSAYVKNCSDGDRLMLGGGGLEGASSTIVSSGEWEFYQASFTYPAGYLGNQIRIGFDISGSCEIDAVKLERGSESTVYSEYRDNGLTYLKLAPDYFACTGQSTDPEECEDFVRQCSQNEEGCNLFTSLSDGMTVPARVTDNDYCPADCVGYDEYLQSETMFNNQENAYFIPRLAMACSSQAVGCDEFTNLDKLGMGAEAREYYKELKQCQKPDASCADFYTWEGSAETGYQLRVHQLRSDAGAPYDISGGAEYNGMACGSEADYNLENNPMCREFYNTGGNVFYAFYPYVLTCSENCHPYRRTEKNVDPAVLAQAFCGGGNLCGDSSSDGDAACWDSVEEQCYSCKNGGVWNYQHGACIYNAIPDEGIKCSAGQAGCREYSGNAGSNMRLLFNNNFEKGTIEGWEGDIAGGNPSNESLIVGEHSLSSDGTVIHKTLGFTVEADKSYVISFIAKSNGAGLIENIGFGSSTNIDVSFEMGLAGVRALGGEWDLYEFNLINLNNSEGSYEISPAEKLFIEVDAAGFYIDDIRLTEIIDRYYLIKNSWTIPDACYYDMNGNAVPDTYNLGCDAYNDQENKRHNLRKFTHLCSDSAVGCEIMIDTHNYSGWEGRIFHEGDMSQEIVPEDNYIYVVYNRDKRCNSRDKGCQLLGDPYHYATSTIYDKVYLKNDPDKYDEILCMQDEAGCSESTSKDGIRYFKEPGDQVCEYRQKEGAGDGGWDWYKQKIKRCDDNGDKKISSTTETQICLSDDDCIGGVFCILDENDYLCPQESSPWKTIGTGGFGGIVWQPKTDLINGIPVNWVGLCPAVEAGCSEYIDPISSFSSNIIFNSDFSQDVDKNSTADGWDGNIQEVWPEAFTLYRFGGNSAAGNTVRLSCSGKGGVNTILQLSPITNLFNAPVNSFEIALGEETKSALLFITTPEDCTITVATAEEDSYTKLEIKPAIVEYQLENKVDTEICNGMIEMEKGCVLFNQRSFSGSSLASLEWDADLSIEDANGVSPLAGLPEDRDSNKIIKVSPDRICDSWLACRSYIKDENNNPVCFDIGLCDSVDKNGNCDSFLLSDKENQKFPSPLDTNRIYNLSGYAKAGWGEPDNNDLYPFGEMEQDGNLAYVPNGDFEFYGYNGYPLGWTNQDLKKSWNSNMFSVIDNPYSAQEEAIEYPREGRAFLKYSPSVSVVESEFIDVESGGEYILSAWINTQNLHPNGVYDYVAPKIEIYTYDYNGNTVGGSGGGRYSLKACDYSSVTKPWINNCPATLNNGHDWTKITKQFVVGDNVNRIKLVLSGVAKWGGNQVCNTSEGLFDYMAEAQCTADGSVSYSASGLGCSVSPSFSNSMTRDTCAGNAYIDNIMLRPGLNKRYQEAESQTCRLYPKDNSLACEYFDNSGIKYKGWYGYCLEYDRYPGDEDVCLMWWPVDKVKGDGIEESAGYKDRFPLYYCIEYSDSASILTIEEDLNGEQCHADMSSPTCHGWGAAIHDPSKWTILGDAAARTSNPLDYPIIVLPEDDWHIQHDEDNDDDYGSSNPEDFHFWFGLTDVDGNTYGFRMDGAWMNVISTNLINATCDYLYPDPNFKCSNWEVNGSPWDGYLPFVPEYTIIDQVEMIGTGDDNDPRYFAIHSTLISMGEQYCKKFAQTVTPVGQNKYWSGRVYEGSDFKIPCSRPGPFSDSIEFSCQYVSDYIPFGSAVVPYPAENPYEWDASDDDGIQPIKYIAEDEIENDNDIRSGQVYDVSNLKNLFAQSYGTWEWDIKGHVCQGGDRHGEACVVRSSSDCITGECRYSVTEEKYFCDDSMEPCTIILHDQSEDCPKGICIENSRYMPVEGDIWGPPANPCPSIPRPEGNYCGIAPVIDPENILVNSLNTDVEIRDNQFINLTFTSEVDNQQLPLVMYAIDWGDGETMYITGVEMRDRPNPENPHSAYHLYSYWDLVEKEASGENDINCFPGYCEVTPKIKVRDNWGWCNGGAVINDCDTWVEFGGTITVKEK